MSQGVSTAPTTPPVDRTILAELRSLATADEPGFVEEMMTSYLNDTPTHLANLRQAITRSDAPAIVRSAHSLVGSSRIIGAGALALLCLDYQQKSRFEVPTDADVLLRKIEDEFKRVEMYLRTFLTEGGTSPREML